MIGMIHVDEQGQCPDGFEICETERSPKLCARIDETFKESLCPITDFKIVEANSEPSDFERIDFIPGFKVEYSKQGKENPLIRFVAAET